MKIQYTLVLLLFIGFISCSSSDEPNNGAQNTPKSTVLVFPEKDKECTEGTVINNFESNITFRWSVAENADYYEIKLRDLTTNETATFNIQTNSVTITLPRGVGYEWYIVSKNNSSSTTATSAKWRFYNQGIGEQSYAPFPAEAVSPTRGQLLNEAGTTNLEWEGTDIDNDIVSYEVFFGTSPTPTTSLGETAQNKVSVTVSASQTYYWVVKTTDSKGNTSNSEVFDFKVL